jgi:hypothetical protein
MTPWEVSRVAFRFLRFINSNELCVQSYVLGKVRGNDNKIRRMRRESKKTELTNTKNKKMQKARSQIRF